MGDTDGNFSYLNMLTKIGYARHIGGKNATDELVRIAGISKGSRVLDVGCGQGRTSCRLAAEIGCTVVGIDIMPQAIEQACATAKKAGVEDRVTFMEGDARNLPFPDGSFDVVMVESVTIFVVNVTKAISEYYRVLRPGGVVCDNEVCLTRKSTEELKDEMAEMEKHFDSHQSLTDRGFLRFEDWADLYRDQFQNVEARHIIADMKTEAVAKQKDGLAAFVSVIKAMYLYYTKPEARKIMDSTRAMGKYVGHFGYGLFVSRKLPQETSNAPGHQASRIPL